MEGDPFGGLAGREYLFGFATLGESKNIVYECSWALTEADEKAAFQWFMDSMMKRWEQYPAMHIYHFAPYEPSALKRLMGRYATREDELDRMLRSKLLVDLHLVTKQTVRASVEQYSLKALEIFHRFEREVSLDDSRDLPSAISSNSWTGRPAVRPATWTRACSRTLP